MLSVCVQKNFVFSIWLSLSLWSESLMSAGMPGGLYVEECCRVLSRSTAQQNQQLSGFHIELLWLDSPGASAEITLVTLSLCTAGYNMSMCACVCVYYSYCCDRVLWQPSKSVAPKVDGGNANPHTINHLFFRLIKGEDTVSLTLTWE